MKERSKLITILKYNTSMVAYFAHYFSLPRIQLTVFLSEKISENPFIIASGNLTSCSHALTKALPLSASIFVLLFCMNIASFRYSR